MFRTRFPNLPKVLCRPRLEHLVESAIGERFTLVCGAPGQGKTTLVANVLKRMDFPVFWYSVDQFGTDPAGFITDLFDFLNELTPDIEASLRGLTSVRETGRFLITSLENLKLDRTIFVVLDDYHTAPVHSDFDELIQFLIANAPPCFHFIVVTRTEPLWNLAHKKVHRQMLEIDNSQLTFTLEETREFFREIFNFDLGESQLSRIMTLTEGWAAAMVLFGEKLSIESDLQELLSGDCLSTLERMPELSSYLEAELLKPLIPVQQNLLLAASVAEEIPGEFARCVAGSEATELLDEIASGNLLLTCMDRTSKTYRCHGLWRAFLYLKAIETWDEARLDELHCIAGSYLLKQEKWKEAFYHFVEGHNVEQAIAVFKQSGPEILDFHLTEKFYALVTQIPLGKMECDPWVQFAYACSLRFRDPTLCYHYINRALNGFRKSNDTKGEIQVLCLKTEVLMFFPGDLHQMQDLIEDKALYSNPEEVSDLRIIGYRGIYAALSHCYLTGWLEEALRLADHSRKTSFVLRDTNLRLWACSVLALTSSFIGNFEVAKGYLMEAFARIKAPGSDEITFALIPYLAGLNSDFMGDFKTARMYLDIAARESKSLKLDALDFYIGHYRAYAADYMGDQAGSERMMDEIASKVRMYLHTDNYHLRSFFLAAKAHHAFLWKQHYQAVDWGRQALKLRREAGGELYFVQCHLILGTALKEVGKFEEAEEHLHQALERSITIASSFFEASCYVQLALLYDALDNKELFSDYVEKAFRLAADRSYYHFFMWRDDHLTRLVNRAQDLVPFRGYMEELRRRRLVQADGFESGKGTDVAALEDNMQKPVRLFMLGPFVAEIGGTVCGNIGARKALYLLKLLALRREPVNSDTLIEEMWPDWEFKLARNNFYFTLHRLRKVLGDKDMIIFKDGLCAIDPECYWADIQHFNYLLDRAKKSYKVNRKQEALDSLVEAARLWRGEFLEGENLGELLSTEREHYARKYHVCLVNSGAVFLELGMPEQAVEVLDQACAGPFSNEHSYRLLMLAHYACGNQWQALELYNKLSQYLRAEMGSGPHRLTEELRELIRNGREICMPETLKWLSVSQGTVS